MSDYEEIYIAGTDPNNPDSDGDGLLDGEDDAPNNGDADHDGLPDGVDEYEWEYNTLFAANAGYTNLVLTVVQGMDPPAQNTPRLLMGTPNASVPTSAMLDIGGLPIPLYTGQSWNLGVPTGQCFPFMLHVCGNLPVVLSLDFNETTSVGTGLWLDDPSGVFSGSVVSENRNGNIAIPALYITPVDANFTPCVHETPGYRDFRAILQPQGWEATHDNAIITGFTENDDGTLRLSVGDTIPSEATGTISFYTPWLKDGHVSASAAIHRCEYPEYGECPKCSEGHDTTGLSIHIEQELYAEQRLSESRVCVRLVSHDAANWSLSPQLEDGARLYASATGGIGQQTMDNATEVWVGAGSQRYTYRLTACHPVAQDVSDETVVAIYRVAELRATSSVAGASPNPPPFLGETTYEFCVTNSAVPDKHLVVFYNDVIDSEFQVQPFSISLEAVLEPSDLPGSVLPIPGWWLISGPDSGSFSSPTGMSTTFDNPSVGGVYRIGFRCGDGPRSEANIVLPLAGASIDAQIASDLPLADSFATLVTNRHNRIARNMPDNGKSWFYDHWMGDYAGRPDNPGSPTIWYYNQIHDISGFGAVVTWGGKPIRLAKASNFMVGYACDKIGVWHIGQWAAAKQLGTDNNESATWSWNAGISVSKGAVLNATVTNLATRCWGQTDEKVQRLWPNPAPAMNHLIHDDMMDIIPHPFNTNYKSPGFLYKTDP